MAVRRTRPVVGILLCCTALVPALAGCGFFGEDEEEKPEPVKVASDTVFPADSTMEKLQDAGTIKIGVKFDQPGIGYREPGKGGDPKGFDVEMARIVAGQLGIAPEKIKWVETQSQDREKFLRNGTVDLVLASYSITPERRKVVGMAGPYYETGQQLLVRKSDKSISGTGDIAGKQVCSAKGATSIERVEKYRAKPVPRGTYAQCVDELLDGSVDAVTTDGALLQGYVAQKRDELKVVGKPFSSERYAVGYRKGDTEMCEFINETLTRSFRDGTWGDALFKTLWKTAGAVGYPNLAPCE